MEQNGKFGLFVEHIGQTKEEVLGLIEKSLKSMIKVRSQYSFGAIGNVIETTAPTGLPTSVIVAAVYELED
jgi:hypothetical protein